MHAATLLEHSRVEPRRGSAPALPIAFVMTRFEPGGTERQMIELISRLPRDRWTVHVACFEAAGAWLGRVERAAASIDVFPVRSLRRAATVGEMRRFARWCRARAIAVVHTAELYSNVFGLPPAAAAGVPARIGNRREINPDKSPGQILLQRGAYSAAHRVVANSRAAADRLRLERVPARKIVVVPNGVDTAPFSTPRGRRDVRRIVTVANLRPEKGHEVLLAAAPIVLRRFPDARFVCVGDGPQRQALEARAHALGVRHAFTFTGHREDVRACLGEADAFALPSRSEAFPNAVLEAMAAGLPIVASATGGILEQLDDGRTGLLAAPGDAASLADRLCLLMADADLAARLGAAARAEASARYSYDRMVAAFESIYLTELGRRGVTRGEAVPLAAS